MPQYRVGIIFWQYLCAEQSTRKHRPECYCLSRHVLAMGLFTYSREFQNHSTILPSGLRQANLQRLKSAFRKLHFDSTCRRRKPAKIPRTFPDMLLENCISIVLVGVVNQRKFPGPFLTSGTNFFVCYPST